MSTTPGYRLVARKGLPRANPGLIINESSGFADGFNDGKDGINPVSRTDSMTTKNGTNPDSRTDSMTAGMESTRFRGRIQ